VDDVRRTSKQIPVMINHHEHVLASADIFRTPDKVLIQITAPANDRGNHLADFLEQAEPIAVSFTAIPVQNTTEKRDTT